jgi:hypothetical protein
LFGPPAALANASFTASLNNGFQDCGEGFGQGIVWLDHFHADFAHAQHAHQWFP